MNDILFGNNNKTIVNKIAKKRIEANKGSNVFVIISIALTTILLTTVFSIGMSYIKSNEMQQIRVMGTTAHAALMMPTTAQLQKLTALDYIKSIGESYNVGEFVNPDGVADLWISFFRFEDNEWENHHKSAITGFVGEAPEKYNEIMTSVWVLNTLGIDDPDIGMEITIPYRQSAGGDIINNKFVLTAYYTDYINIRTRNVNSILVSDEFAKASGNSLTENGNVMVTFKDTNNIPSQIERLANDVNLKNDQTIKIVPLYEAQKNTDLTSVLGLLVVMFIIIFCGYLLISNILYISVTKDIRFYGLLNTIGTTPKQLRTIVTRQALYLSLIGILVGTVIGGVLSFVVVPLALSSTAIETGTLISFNPLIFIGAAVFALLTTLFSAIKPSKIAGRITPVEAVRYTERIITKTSKKGTGGGKLSKMVQANVFRDKKRSIVVLMSLFFGITTFLAVSTLIQSLDSNQYVSGHIEYDFSVTNKTYTILNTNLWVKRKFNETFLNAVNSMVGVTKVQTIYVQNYNPEYDEKIFLNNIKNYAERHKLTMPTQEELESGWYLNGFLVGIDVEYIEKLNQTLKTPIDLKAFENGEIALLGTDFPELFPLDAQVNGKAVDNEHEFSLSINRFVRSDYLVPSISGETPNLYISKKVFLKIVDDPIIYKVNIEVDPKSEKHVSDSLKSMIQGDYELSMESKSELLASINSMKIVMYITGGGISLILAFIGVLNFINVIFTSITIRRIELAMLESIGMTKRQIRRMLTLEGIWYFALTFILLITIGNGISLGLFTLFKQIATFAVINFPIIPITCVTLVLLFTCMVTPLISYSFINKETLVERLKD